MARHFGRLTRLAIVGVACAMQAFAQTPAPDGSGLPGANVLRATLSQTALSERVVEYDDDGFGVELLEVSDQRSGEIKVMSPQTIRFAVAKPPHF